MVPTLPAGGRATAAPDACPVQAGAALTPGGACAGRRPDTAPGSTGVRWPQWLGAGLLCALLAGCASAPPAPPVAHHPPKRPPPVQSVPAEAPEAVAPDPDTAAAAAPARQAQSAAQAAEWQQLARYQKSPLQVFVLGETQARLKPMRGAIGVYGPATVKPGSLRLRLALRPDTPVKLSAGTYAVNVQVAYDYTERRTCQVPSCHGEIEETTRRAVKTVRFQLSPQRNYMAEAMLPLVQVKQALPDRGYDISYADLVLKVRRITVAPVRSKEVAP